MIYLSASLQLPQKLIGHWGPDSVTISVLFSSNVFACYLYKQEDSAISFNQLIVTYYLNKVHKKLCLKVTNLQCWTFYSISPWPLFAAGTCVGLLGCFWGFFQHKWRLLLESMHYHVILRDIRTKGMVLDSNEKIGLNTKKIPHFH